MTRVKYAANSYDSCQFRHLFFESDLRQHIIPVVCLLQTVPLKPDLIRAGITNRPQKLAAGPGTWFFMMICPMNIGSLHL